MGAVRNWEAGIGWEQRAVGVSAERLEGGGGRDSKNLPMAQPGDSGSK